MHELLAFESNTKEREKEIELGFSFFGGAMVCGDNPPILLRCYAKINHSVNVIVVLYL